MVNVSQSLNSTMGTNTFVTRKSTAPLLPRLVNMDSTTSTTNTTTSTIPVKITIYTYTR